MKQIQKVGLDCGRYSVKYFTDDLVPRRFPAIVGSWHKRNLYGGGNFDVTIDGEDMFVGKLALEESQIKRSMTIKDKIHEETKNLFLCAIGSIVKPDHNIFVTTGLPVNLFDEENKDKLLNLLKGEHTIRVNKNEPVTFEIVDIKVTPEGGATFWNEVLNHQGEIQKEAEMLHGIKRIINVGSKTINGATLMGKKYNNKNSITLDYGMYQLLNWNEHPTPEQLRQFARQIVGDLSKKWWDYKETDTIVVTGGGALQLEPYFKEHYAIVKKPTRPIFSEAEGMYKMGVMLCQQMA